MAKNNNLKDFVTGIASAIREKKGTTELINPQDFENEIRTIQTGVDTSDATATAEEFWSYFDHKLYPYNPGETQPLFKISRKSQWGSTTPASLYVGEDIIIPQIVRN